MSQSHNELDTIRQRARQAVEYYKRHVNSASADSSPPGGRSGLSINSKSPAYQRSVDKDSAQDHYDRVGGQLQGQRSSMEDMLQGGVAPASSNTFYRAKMKAGIIDMRSSYNERIGSGSSRQRSRTFHGPHTGRTRTQTYAVDPKKATKPSAVVVGTVKEAPPPPPQRPKLASPPSPSPPHNYHQQQGVVGGRVGAVKRGGGRGLYRSNSNLEIDSVECVEEDLPPSTLHRQYGSTSSLDLLAAAPDNLATVLRDFKNGNSATADPRLWHLMQQQPQQKAVNGTGERGEEEEGKGKGKGKGKESRKVRAKSITGDGSSSAGILKKLRGVTSKQDAGDAAANKTDDKGSEEAPSEDKQRQKAFVHFDCQSIGVRLNRSSRAHTGSLMKNITTGASAASVKRNSYAVSSDKEIGDVTEEDDAGDGKSNDLVHSCPFFRNEVGGGREEAVSVRQLTAGSKLLSPPQSAATPTPTLTASDSAMSSPFLRHPACCGLAILDSSPSPSGQILPPLVTHRGHVIEYVDHGAYYYRHFFYNYDHQNLFGTDEHLGPVAVSVRREKLDPEERANNLGKADYGTYHYRIICRTSQLTTLRGCVLEDAVPSSGRLSSSRGVPLKEVLEVALGEVQLSCLKQATPGPKTAEQLLKLDEQGICTTYKVGIMYCCAGQSTEEEMYNNESGSPVFDEFLNLIAQKVRLKGFDKYRGGLDCKTDTTGLHSYYTTFNNNEIMFHVSSILPFTPNNQQQLLRKRHIGNDIVTIVFQEPGALPFSPRSVRSQFQHVFIIVKVDNPNSENTRYSIAVTRSKDVPAFGPPIPVNGGFCKSPEFVDFLMAKIINAENAAHKSEKFRTMAQRTRQEYLKDLAANFSTNSTLDSGSKLSKFALGSGRKKEKSKQKVVPDMFAKGALVWNVQVEDMSSAVQVESMVAIAADTIVVVDAATKDVIFTVPCSTVIGWTLQASSIRLYFGQGECILLRPLSGDMEEMTEIITRLTAVSQGTETVKMVLKRNGLGQLGFHIQSEGIVTDVEPYGFAWEVGLRKGSRLVEICKVATSTLNHDQIVDLLRTSAVVKVVVVPPLEDGTPRGDNRPSVSGSRSSINTPNSNLTNSSSNYYDQLTQRQTGGGNMAASHGYSDSTLSSGRGSDDGRSSSFFTHSRQESDVYASSHSRQESDLYASSHGSHDGHLYASSHGSHDGHLSSGDELHSRNESHDSSEFSLASTGAGRRGPSSSARQPQAALRRGEGTNYVNMEGSTPNAYLTSTESSTPNAYLTSTESIYSAVSQHTNYQGPRRQFANMDYTSSSMPVTGNIALELLKQTQNTKYLLGQEAPPNAHPAPPPGPGTPGRPPVSEGRPPLSEDGAYNAALSSQSVSGTASHVTPLKPEFQRPNNREDTFPRRKDSSQLRKGYTGKKHLDASPMSSTNSSPRSSSKNLSGMSSEESLNSRLRGHQRGSGDTVTSGVNFQEELKRLIDPDISESDLATLTAQTKVASNRRGGRRLQRTYSDESLHSTKGTSSVAPGNDLSIGTDLIFTSAVPKVVDSRSGSDRTAAERLSPRAVADVGRHRAVRTQADGRRLPDAMSLDWSDLVHVATKAIESDNRPPPPPPPHIAVRPDKHRPDSEDEAPPPPRPPSPKDSVSLSSSIGIPAAAWLTLSSDPEQRVAELEVMVHRLQADLDKERRHGTKMEAEIQDLRADNVRLQEESQTAAAQLRRFTEWFFNTIDRQ
ncbi:hypothetical protein V1264_019565 [Littorina saxatilis]|uniref:Signal-induced proliferation-associated 1-like protein 2 n=1 Tax=Littorina saxatilis TaxID=31220 RepID=A0AAN9GDE8_9CAEN